MRSTNVSVQYRPVRIGFLVRQGSVEDIVKAAGLNTLLWGGICNPLIPVGKDTIVSAEQLIDLFAVDVLFAVSDSAEILELIKKYPFLRDPGHYSKTIYYDDFSGKKSIGFLDIKGAIEYFWEKTYKHKPETFKSNFLLLKWDPNDPLSNLFSIQFGYFPVIQGIEFKHNYEHLFVRGLCADQRKISHNATLSNDFVKRHTPIQCTAAKLTGYPRGARMNQNGIYVGKSNNFNDLVCFWNLRASGICLSYFANDLAERTFSFAQSQLEVFDALPDRNPNFLGRLTIYYMSDNGDAISEIVKKFATKKTLTRHQVSEASWNGFNIQPASFSFGRERVVVDIDESDGRFEVVIKLPEKKFLTNSEKDADWQHLAVMIDSYSDLGYHGHTLNPPYLRELNEFYARKITIGPWSLRIESEGIACIEKVYDNYISLYPIPYYSLVEKLFEVIGLKIKKSQPGLLADKIIDRLNGLEGARALKIKGVRKLLQGQKANIQYVTIDGNRERQINYIKAKFVDRKGAIRVIGVSDFEKHKRLYIERRDLPELTPDQVFNFLLKKDFFRAGLEVQCSDCRLKSWLSLVQLDDKWICESCGSSNTTTLLLKDSGDWKFRKSGLFAKDNNQEGSIPVLLTLLTFQRVLNHSDLIYTSSLKVNGENIDCEIDFSILQYKSRGDIEFCIGECKNEGGLITQDDCDKLLSVYNKIESDDRMKCYMTFAKTADSFTSEELDRFKKLKEQNIRLILFTNQEMEPYFPYWKEDGDIDDDIPEKYPHSLSDFSINSVSRYLSQ